MVQILSCPTWSKFGRFWQPTCGNCANILRDVYVEEFRSVFGASVRRPERRWIRGHRAADSCFPSQPALEPAFDAFSSGATIGAMKTADFHLYGSVEGPKSGGIPRDPAAHSRLGVSVGSALQVVDGRPEVSSPRCGPPNCIQGSGLDDIPFCLLGFGLGSTELERSGSNLA